MSDEDVSVFPEILVLLPEPLDAQSPKEGLWLKSVLKDLGHFFVDRSCVTLAILQPVYIRSDEFGEVQLHPFEFLP